MKLLFAIIQNEDEKALTRSLVEQDFSVTRISSSGGFLKSGNATLMIGVEDGRLPAVLAIVNEKSQRRNSLLAATDFPMKGGGTPLPVEVEVGGATVFVVDVEAFHKF